MLVTMGDVDSAGVIFFASVYRWHERAFFEWLGEIGQPLRGVLDSGRGLPVRASWAEYPAPASLGDDLVLTRSVSALAETEFVFQTTWRSSAGIVAEVSTQHVACRRDTSSDRFVRSPIWPELHAILLDLRS
jgi:YbgC/YbaW family acyl-CoA thioester hydrolase